MGVTGTQKATHATVTCTNGNTAQYPDYIPVNDRLQSFNRGWPDYVRQAPQMMVESGFFFAGYEDCVRCFQCGIGLRNWEPADIPHVEHARWSPKCPFLIGVKGQDFINSVLDTVPPLAIRNEQRANDPPVHMESNQAGGALLQTSQQIQEKSTTTKNTVKTGASARTEGASVNTPSQTNTSAANTDADILQLRNENRRMREMFICKICRANTVSIAFESCGHLVVCTKCAGALIKCPICQKLIKGRVCADLNA